MGQIEDLGGNTQRALQLLLPDELVGAALVVLYSAIDTLAWSTRTTGDVTATDFIEWVNQYMDPVAKLGCTAGDLYAARCGLVHSGAAESKMSRKGAAMQLWYATHERGVPAFQDLATGRGITAKVISVERLLAVFQEGVASFVTAVKSDPIVEKRVTERIRTWLHFSRELPGSTSGPTRA